MSDITALIDSIRLEHISRRMLEKEQLLEALQILGFIAHEDLDNVFELKDSDEGLWGRVVIEDDISIYGFHPSSWPNPRRATSSSIFSGKYPTGEIIRCLVYVSEQMPRKS